MSEPTIRGVSTADRDAALPRPFGTFTLLKRIAEGERGHVYAALRPVEVDRFCALKLLPERGDFVGDLRTEATRLVRQIHGNLVPIYDVGVVDGRLFVASELVDGASVETMVGALGQRRQPFPVPEALFVAMEIASAAGFLRRALGRTPATAAASIRIQPRSVMLSMDGEVKLLYYGTTLDRAHKTPGASNAAEDARAVAALLWQTLVGRPYGEAGAGAGIIGGSPFGGGASGPSLAPRALPPAVDRLLRATLAREGAAPVPGVARPRDCDELRGALATLLRDLSPVGTPSLGPLIESTVGADRPGARAALTALAEGMEAKRRSGPPTGKVITLTRIAGPSAPRSGAGAGAGAGVEAGASAGTGAGEAAVRATDLAAGQVIPGTRYRIQSKIGQGGMGAVYAAEHVDLEKKVALKVLRNDVAPDPDTLQLFRQEARAASKIGNLYICDVTDFGEVPDGRVFFVMEYLDGVSLGRVLREAPRLPPERAIPILRQIAKALGAAHDKGIVHLDVKPDNVMLLERGRRTDAVKVVDFGIAGLLHQKGEEESISGTPEYVAPERAGGTGYDGRSDIYALGIVAYEMLAGVVPFQGKSHLATLTMQVKDAPEPIGRKAPELATELQSLVMSMLQKDPAARPQSMAAVEALLCEAQIEAGFTTPWDDLELPAVDDAWRAKLAKRMPSPGRSARRAAMAGAIAVAVGGVALAVYFGVIRKPRVVVKEVRVELTHTEEAPAVAAALLEADKAARRQRYVAPPEDSALHYIEKAEVEASKIDITRPSPGAAALRRAYASGLAVIGNELLKAGLRDLAIVKYKEALLFLPEDPELQAKAELTPEEKKIRTRPPGAAPTAPAPAPRVDPAKEAATRAFVAALEGRTSEARLALRTLAEMDIGGTQSAKLADGLRSLAGRSWSKGQLDRARPLYQLISELDPKDLEAALRAKPGSGVPVAPPPKPAPVAATPPPAPAPVAKPRKREVEAPEPAAPRDEAASQKAAATGQAALARGRLAEAEEAFNRAVRADSTNAVAVGGLAEVAFEHARYAEALDYARRASRLAPQSPKHLTVLGDAYFKLLRYDEAQAAYQKAQSLSPRDESIKSRLDRVRAKLGSR